METGIKTKAQTGIQLLPIKQALQTLADNVDVDNLQFLADLSRKKGINEKLRANKTMIKLAI